MRRAYSIVDLPGVDPHRKLAAAIVKQAIADAGRGDAEARAWCRDEGAGLLALIVPDTADPAAIMTHLIGRT